MNRLIRSTASAVALVTLLLLAACDDPVMDAARAANFHDGRAAFVSEVERPEDARRRDLLLRVNFSGEFSTVAQSAIVLALPALYQGDRKFVWFRPPGKFPQGTMQRCGTYPSTTGGPPVVECVHSSLYVEGVFKIWPDKGGAIRPYRTRDEAMRILMRALAKEEGKTDVFYCGRAGNSCALVELPKPAK